MNDVNSKFIQSKSVRYTLITFSFFFLILGLIGAFVPLLPTTPFVLLSATLFARSSPKFYHWIISHKILGPPIKLWQENKAISPKSKVSAIIMIIATIGTSAIFFVSWMPAKVTMIVIGLVLTVFIASRPNY